MIAIILHSLASFSTPMDIANSPMSLLWIVPLVILISAVYKATKFEQIHFKRFIRETVVLIGSILGFMLLIAVILYFVVEWTT